MPQRGLNEAMHVHEMRAQGLYGSVEAWLMACLNAASTKQCMRTFAFKRKYCVFFIHGDLRGIKKNP